MHEFSTSGTTSVDKVPALDDIFVFVGLAQMTKVGEKSTATKGHVNVAGAKLIEAMILPKSQAKEYEAKLRAQAQARDADAIADGLGDTDL